MYKKSLLKLKILYHSTYVYFYYLQSIDSPPAEPSEVEVPHHWVRIYFSNLLVYYFIICNIMFSY